MANSSVLKKFRVVFYNKPKRAIVLRLSNRVVPWAKLTPMCLNLRCFFYFFVLLTGGLETLYVLKRYEPKILIIKKRREPYGKIRL